MTTTSAMLILAATLLGGPSGQPANQLTVDSVLVTLIEQVEVAARETGVLASIAVREGQLVEEGTLLAQIEDIESQLEKNRAQIELDNARKKASNDIKLRYAKKSLELAQADLKRAVDSHKRFANAVSEAEIDRLKLQADKAALEIEQAEHEFDLAQADVLIKQNELLIAERNIQRRKVPSPLAGVVVQINRHRGEWVEPSESVLRILRINPLRAEGFVNARDVTADLTGRPVTLAVDLPGKPKSEFSGSIVFVSPEVNPVNGQIRVWAEIENRDLLLRPGLRATMTIDTTATLATQPTPASK
jgi:RND family efflux transporter MFP subunit